jgi:hypothetical protein
MRERISAVVLLLGLLDACSPSRAALTFCTIPDGGGPSSCPSPLECMIYYAEGPDGLCHGVIGAVCALPCQSNADCAPLGQNSSCYTCPAMPGTSGVCTAFQ